MNNFGRENRIGVIVENQWLTRERYDFYMACHL